MSVSDILRMILSKKGVEVGFISKALGLPEERVLRIILSLRGLELKEGKVHVSSPLQLALSAIEAGANPYVVSRFLSWQDFEAEVEEVLSRSGFAVARNVTIRFPTRAEIDVIGVEGSTVLLVDCKHWDPKYTCRSRLESVIKRHKDRVKKSSQSSELARLLRKMTHHKNVELYGVIVTLSSKVKGIIEGIPVVPVSLLSAFIRELDELKDEMYCAKMKLRV